MSWQFTALVDRRKGSYFLCFTGPTKILLTSREFNSLECVQRHVKIYYLKTSNHTLGRPIIAGNWEWVRRSSWMGKKKTGHRTRTIGERDESVCRRTQHKNECKRQMCTWASIQAARQAGWQAASIEATHTLVAAGRQRMPAHLPLLISIFGVHPYTDMRCVCMAGPRCWSSVRVNIQRRQKYSVSSHNSSFLSDSLIWCVPGFLYRYACVIFLSFPP